MRFIKNFILLIVFCCLIASFFITKEKPVETSEIKTSQNIYNKKNESINEFKKDNKYIEQITYEEEIPTQVEKPTMEEDYKKEVSEKVASIISESTKEAFSKGMIGKVNLVASSYRPTEEFITIVDSYQDAFVPLDTLPETKSLCFDSNYNKYSFGIITIVENNGVKEVYECVYTSEDSGKWMYRGLADNQN